MITIYQKFHNKDEQGRWYTSFEVPDGFPYDPYVFTQEAPSPDLKFPKWNFTEGAWEEDAEEVESYRNKVLVNEIVELNKTVLEMSEMLLKGGLM